MHLLDIFPHLFRVYFYFKRTTFERNGNKNIFSTLKMRRNKNIINSHEKCQRKMLRNGECFVSGNAFITQRGV